jgi:Sugar-transfer associated ATP-grasp
MPIQQNEFFDRIIAGSVATIRLTTVKDRSGRIALRAAYLRLGRTDTEWVQSNNSIRVAIQCSTGELDNFGYTPDWKRCEGDPDTRYRFQNQKIPKFKTAVELCLALDSKVPHFTVIGWDVTLDQAEHIKLMEWNSAAVTTNHHHYTPLLTAEPFARLTVAQRMATPPHDSAVAAHASDGHF